MKVNQTANDSFTTSFINEDNKPFSYVSSKVDDLQIASTDFNNVNRVSQLSDNVTFSHQETIILIRDLTNKFNPLIKGKVYDSKLNLPITAARNTMRFYIDELSYTIFKNEIFHLNSKNVSTSAQVVLNSKLVSFNSATNEYIFKIGEIPYFSISKSKIDQYLSNRVEITKAIISLNINNIQNPEILTKEYDGNHNLSQTIVLKSASEIYKGDVVNYTVSSSIYENAVVGDNKIVIIKVSQILGKDGINYKFDNLDASSTYSFKLTNGSITKAKLTKPEINSDFTYIYNATEQEVKISNLSDKVTALGTLKATNVSSNIVSVKINDSSSYSWNDGSIQDINLVWKIVKKDITIFENDIPSISKTYDGTVNIPSNLGINSSLIEPADSSKIKILLDGRYTDKNAGSDKGLELTFVLTGENSNNYNLVNNNNNTKKGTILPLEVSINSTDIIPESADSRVKEYDGTTKIGFSPSVKSLTTIGFLQADLDANTINITVDGKYTDKNVGINKSIKYTVSISGNDGKNYSLSNKEILTTGSINAKVINKDILFNAVFVEKIEKTYDGTTKFPKALTINNNALTNHVLEGENITINAVATYQDANAGIKNLLLTVSLSGSDAKNYLIQDGVSQVDVVVNTIAGYKVNKANISIPQTALISTKIVKEYDGTTDVKQEIQIDKNLIEGAVKPNKLGIISAKYEDKNIGENKNIILILNSIDIANFNIINNLTFNIGSIKQRNLAVIDLDSLKTKLSYSTIYDGTSVRNFNAESNINSSDYSQYFTKHFEPANTDFKIFISKIEFRDSFVETNKVYRVYFGLSNNNYVVSSALLDGGIITKKVISLRNNQINISKNYDGNNILPSINLEILNLENVDVNKVNVNIGNLSTLSTNVNVGTYTLNTRATLIGDSSSNYRFALQETYTDLIINYTINKAVLKATHHSDALVIEKEFDGLTTHPNPTSIPASNKYFTGFAKGEEEKFKITVNSANFQYSTIMKKMNVNLKMSINSLNYEVQDYIFPNGRIIPRVITLNSEDIKNVQKYFDNNPSFNLASSSATIDLSAHPETEKVIFTRQPFDIKIKSITFKNPYVGTNKELDITFTNSNFYKIETKTYNSGTILKNKIVFNIRNIRMLAGFNKAVYDIENRDIQLPYNNANGDNRHIIYYSRNLIKFDGITEINNKKVSGFTVGTYPITTFKSDNLLIFDKQYDYTNQLDFEFILEKNANLVVVQQKGDVVIDRIKMKIYNHTIGVVPVEIEQRYQVANIENYQSIKASLISLEYPKLEIKANNDDLTFDGYNPNMGTGGLIEVNTEIGGYNYVNSTNIDNGNISPRIKLTSSSMLILTNSFIVLAKSDGTGDNGQYIAEYYNIPDINLNLKIMSVNTDVSPVTYNDISQADIDKYILNIYRTENGTKKLYKSVESFTNSPPSAHFNNLNDVFEEIGYYNLEVTVRFKDGTANAYSLYNKLSSYSSHSKISFRVDTRGINIQKDDLSNSVYNGMDYNKEYDGTDIIESTLKTYLLDIRKYRSTTKPNALTILFKPTVGKVKTYYDTYYTQKILYKVSIEGSDIHKYKLFNEEPIDTIYILKTTKKRINISPHLLQIEKTKVYDGNNSIKVNLINNYKTKDEFLEQLVANDRTSPPDLQIKSSQFHSSNPTNNEYYDIEFELINNNYIVNKYTGIDGKILKANYSIENAQLLKPLEYNNGEFIKINPTDISITIRGVDGGVLSPVIKLEYNNFDFIDIGTTQDINVIVPGDNNYNDAKYTIKATMAKILPKYIFPEISTTFTYTGNVIDIVKHVHKFTGIKDKFNRNISITSIPDSPLKFTNVADGNNMKYRITAEENRIYLSQNKEITITVNKKTLTFTSVANEFIYNGKPQTALQLNDDFNKFIEVNGSLSATDAGSYSVTLSLLDTNNTQWNDSSATPIQISYIIHPKHVDIDLPEDNSLVYTYDGTEKNVIVTIPEFINFTSNSNYTLEGNVVTIRETNAGVYGFTISAISDKNILITNSRFGQFTSINKALTINKAETIISTTNINKTFTYNGNLQSVSYEGVESNNTDKTLKYLISNNSFTTVAEGNALNVKITTNETENFNGASTTFKINTKKAKIIYPKLVSNRVFEYDGSEHQLTVQVQNGVSENGIKSSKNPGKYQLIYTLNDSDNTEWIDGNTNATFSINWLIRKKQATLNVDSIIKTYVYNSQMQTVSINGYISNNTDTYNFIVTNNTFTTVNEGNNLNVSLKIPETENFLPVEKTFKIFVEKLKIKLPKRIDNNNLIYTGQPLSILLDYDNTNSDIIGNLDYTNAGKYNISIVLKDKLNTVWDDLDTEDKAIAWIIEKQATTINVAEVPKTYIYNKKLQTVDTSKATTNNTDVDASLKVTNNQFTTIEEGNSLIVEIISPETTNFKRAISTFTINVEKLKLPEVNIIGLDKVYTYDGNEVVISTSDEGYSLVGTTRAINAGIYNFKLVLDDILNTSWNNGATNIINKQFSINKAIATLDISQIKKDYIYTGEEQTIEYLSKITTNNTDLNKSYDVENTTFTTVEEGNALIFVIALLETENFLPVHKTLQINVSKMKLDPVNIEGLDKEYVYNGKEVSIQATGNRYKVVGDTTAVNAGTHKFSLSLLDNLNTTWADGTNSDIEKQFIIKKAESTVDTTGINKQYIYTGKLQEILIDGATTTNTDNSKLIAENNTFTTRVEAENLNVIVISPETENFNKSQSSFKITVNKAKIYLNDLISTINEYTYNGQTINVYNGAENNLVEVQGTYHADNAGNYNYILKPINDDVEWSDGTSAPKNINWKILKAETTIDTDKINKNYIYNEKEQTVSIEGVESNRPNKEYIVKNNKFTTVDEGNKLEVNIYLNESKNYKATSKSFKIKVEKMSFVIKDITKNLPNEVEYDGFYHNIIVNDKLLVTGDIKEKNVGNYKAKITLKDLANYKFDSSNENSIEYYWQISPKIIKAIIKPNLRIRSAKSLDKLTIDQIVEKVVGKYKGKDINKSQLKGEVKFKPTADKTGYEIILNDITIDGDNSENIYVDAERGTALAKQNLIIKIDNKAQNRDKNYNTMFYIYMITVAISIACILILTIYLLKRKSRKNS